MTLTFRFTPAPSPTQTPVDRANQLCEHALVRVSLVGGTFEVDSSEPTELAKYVLSMSTTERLSIKMPASTPALVLRRFGVAGGLGRSGNWVDVPLPAGIDVMSLFEALDIPVGTPKADKEPRPAAADDSVLAPELVQAGQILRDAAEKAFETVQPMLFREGRKLLKQFRSL